MHLERTKPHRCAFSTFANDIFVKLKIEWYKSTDVRKLVFIVKVYVYAIRRPRRPSNPTMTRLCGLLIVPASSTFRQKCLKQILQFLVHRYPKVRREAAEAIYMTFLTYADVFEFGTEQVMEEVNQLLVETDWMAPVAQVKEIKNSIVEKLIQ